MQRVKRGEKKLFLWSLQISRHSVRMFVVEKETKETWSEALLKRESKQLLSLLMLVPWSDKEFSLRAQERNLRSAMLWRVRRQKVRGFRFPWNIFCGGFAMCQCFTLWLSVMLWWCQQARTEQQSRKSTEGTNNTNIYASAWCVPSTEGPLHGFLLHSFRPYFRSMKTRHR